MTDNSANSDSLGGNILNVALICPNEHRAGQSQVHSAYLHAAIVREYSFLSPDDERNARMLGEKAFDAVIIDLDSDSNMPWN